MDIISILPVTPVAPVAPVAPVVWFILWLLGEARILFVFLFELSYAVAMFWSLCQTYVPTILIIVSAKRWYSVRRSVSSPPVSHMSYSCRVRISAGWCPREHKPVICAYFYVAELETEKTNGKRIPTSVLVYIHIHVSPAHLQCSKYTAACSVDIA